MWHWLARLLFAGFVFVWLGQSVTAVLAQQASASLTKEAIAELSDEQVRRLLLEKLSGETSRPAAGHGDEYHPAVIAFRLQRAFGKVQERAYEIFGTIGDYPAIPGRAWHALTDNREYGSFARFLWVLIIALIIAAAIEVLLRSRFLAIESALANRETSGLATKAGAVFGVFLTRLARAAVFLGVATAIYFIFAEDETRDRTVFVFYMSAIAIIRVVAAAANSYFAPWRPAIRIPSFDDAGAKKIYWTIMGTVVFGAFGFFTCALFGTLGIVGDVHTLLLISVGAMTTALLAGSIYLNRRAIAGDICPDTGDAQKLRSVCSRVYPYLLMVFIVVLFIALVTAAFLDYNARFGAALFTVAVGLVWPGLDAALEREATLRSQDNDQVAAAAMRVIRLALLCLLVFLLALGLARRFLWHGWQWGRRAVGRCRSANCGYATRSLRCLADDPYLD